MKCFGLWQWGEKWKLLKIGSKKRWTLWNMPDITVWIPAGPKLAAVPGLPQVRIIRWWIDDEGNDKKMIIHPHYWWYLKHNNPKKLLPIILSFFSSKTRQEDERSGEEEWKNVQVVRIYNNKEESRKQKMLILRGAFKNYVRIFSVKGGGVPPFPLSFFEHNDFPLRGGGVPPNSVKEKIR